VRTVAVTVLVVIAVIVLAGCTRQQIDAEQAQVVRSYAQGLVSTLEAESLDGISPYATPREVGRMRLYVVMLLEERRVRVDAQLLSQEILATTSLSDSSANVVAFERWSLAYYDHDTGEFSSREDSEGETTYGLVRVDGRWYVDEVVAQ